MPEEFFEDFCLYISKEILEERRETNEQTTETREKSIP